MLMKWSQQDFTNDKAEYFSRHVEYFEAILL